MKKFSYFAGALSALLVGVSASAAANSYVPNCCTDNCEWSFCDGKFMVEADWLYWQTEQTNMNVVQITDADLNTKNILPDTNYENGYRVGVGYQVPSNGWEFKVVYTNMPIHAANSAIYPAGSDISTGISNIFSDTSGPGPGRVGIKWDGNINDIDVDVGRTLSFGECFRLRPHIGFRALWADQKYKVRLVDLESDRYDFLVIDAKEKFNSYGVEAGLGASWNIGSGFSLLGHFGGSLLYTNFNLNSSYAATNLPGQTPVFHQKGKPSLGTSTLDYCLGLAYTSTFCETELDIYAGWEQHVLFDVNQLLLGTGDNSGNWYTQGLTLGLRAAF